MIRRRIQLILPTNLPTLNILLNLRHQRLDELLVTTNQRHRVPLIAPTRVTTNLNAERVRTSCKVSQVRRDSALRERRAEQEAIDALALRVRQPGQQTGLEVLEQSLKETGYAREDVDVAADHRDRHPHVVGDEDGLLRVWKGGVVREFDHAQLRGEAWGWGFPVEMGLHGVGTGEFLHPLKGGLVQFEFQTECFGYRLVGDVVVAFRRENIEISLV